MLFRVGPNSDEIRTELMQQALGALEVKLLPGLPILTGPLAEELGVEPKLLTGKNAHIKPEWDTYSADMMAESNPQKLRQIHATFLKLEGI